MLRFAKLNVYLLLVVSLFFVDANLSAQFEVKKITLKETSSLNNTIGFKGVSVNVFYRDAANRHKEFARKFKSSNFEGELNYWYVDSSSNEFSYELFDFDLGSTPILIITDFNWNIRRLNTLFKDKSANVELKFLKSDLNGRYFYKLVKSSGMCTSKEEFDFYMSAIELTIKDLAEVYYSVERLGDQKYLSKEEYRKFQSSTDSLIRRINLDWSDSLNVLKRSFKSKTIREEGFSKFLGFEGNYFKSFNDGNIDNYSLSFGVGYRQKCLGLNVITGIQRVSVNWKSSLTPFLLSELNSINGYFDKLQISSSDIREAYLLNNISSISNLEGRLNLGKTKMYLGLRGSVSISISSKLKYENTGGSFNYIGLSDAIEEPLDDIPELGLVSNVSYVGTKGEIQGKLLPYHSLGGLVGKTFGEGPAPLDVYLSVGYNSSKRFNLDHSNSVISSSYGNYNSLATINASHVSVPGYLNFGIGLRKYLN